MARKQAPNSAATPAVPEPPILDDGPVYPGGITHPAYRWAFTAYAVLFLLLVCLGLANYLVWYLRARAA
jgi:hypothetical protein